MEYPWWLCLVGNLVWNPPVFDCLHPLYIRLPRTFPRQVYRASRYTRMVDPSFKFLDDFFCENVTALTFIAFQTPRIGPPLPTFTGWLCGSPFPLSSIPYKWGEITAKRKEILRNWVQDVRDLFFFSLSFAGSPEE